MPRSSGRSSGGGGRPSAPSRPSAPPPSRAPQQQQQTRPMSSVPATRPAGAAAAPAPAAQAGSAGPGLFGQMASTAAGVAVGSSIGHAIGGFFGGGGSSAPAAQEYQQPIDSYAQPGQEMNSGLYAAQGQGQGQAASGPCANDIRAFTGCMEQNGGSMDICGYYLEQLKACQAAARNY